MVFVQWALLYQVQWELKWFFLKKVLSINGDAGFFMNVQDLETAVRNNLNIVAVVWLDGEYGLIKWKQQIQFEGEHSNLKFDNPNFSIICKILKYVGNSNFLQKNLYQP